MPPGHGRTAWPLWPAARRLLLESPRCHCQPNAAGGAGGFDDEDDRYADMNDPSGGFYEDDDGQGAAAAAGGGDAAGGGEGAAAEPLYEAWTPSACAELDRGMLPIVTRSLFGGTVSQQIVAVPDLFCITEESVARPVVEQRTGYGLLIKKFLDTAKPLDEIKDEHRVSTDEPVAAVASVRFRD